MRNENSPLLKTPAVFVSVESDTSSRSTRFETRFAPLDNRLPTNAPSTNEQIAVHRSRKRTLEKGFDARASFVHFAHRSLKNAVHVEDLLQRHTVRNFFYRAKWFRRPLVVRLHSFMTSCLVSVCSFLSLLIALFCSDIFAFFGVPDNTECDLFLSIAFGFFVFEFLGNALSDRTYLLSFFFFMDFIGTFSMVFDISYLYGADVTSFERLDLEEKGGGGVIVVRAARAARVGTRAGRLSRVAKIVRFLSGDVPSQNSAKMAQVISNKLSDVLSIRIAFVVIIIAVVFPSFSIFEYPLVEESMSAWTQLLADEVASFRQGATSKPQLDETVRRMSSFYGSLNYGPFLACSREQDTELPDCNGGFLLHFPDFSLPARGEFVLVTSVEKLDVLYDLSGPKKMEALMGISLIGFSILAMLIFGTLLSENISTVAIAPMERMLDVVRHRCAQIFKYTAELQEDSEAEEDMSEGPDVDNPEVQPENEFQLLEKAVSKLSAIASLSASDDPKESAPLNEDDLLVMNWTHGRGFITYSVDFGAERKPTIRHGNKDKAVQPKDVVGVEALYKQVPMEMRELSRTENFDPIESTVNQKKALCTIHLLEHPGSKDFVAASIDAGILIQFVLAAERAYNPLPFHNFGHAVDVVVTLGQHLTSIQATSFCSNVEQFGLLLAAVGHDLAHPGVSNPFLIETRHELAVTYNDKSPLENMHCAKLFQMMVEPELNVLGRLDKETYQEIRKNMIEVILHTDITKHNEMVKDLSLFYQVNSETLDMAEFSEEAEELLKMNRATLMNALLHCADVNNPAKPWNIAEKLAYLCMDEFFAQGDREKELEIPVGMLNDRDKVNRANSQIGFIEFMIAPFIEAYVCIFPSLDSLAKHTSSNIEKWAKLWQAEADPPQEQVDKVGARVKKVVMKMETAIRITRAVTPREVEAGP
mmetsp:Transcript_4587/g.10744  ORF Transcript_4587/g.10744 Transcript_4587/m.10744 type:complete len:930 (+) Transcript_4587:89-2878(+)